MPFRSLIDYLEQGSTLAEFLEDFPTVTHERAHRDRPVVRALALLRIAARPPGALVENFAETAQAD